MLHNIQSYDYMLPQHCSNVGKILGRSIPPKGGYQGATSLFPTWFPLMWSLECLVCFDLLEKLSPFLFVLGGNTEVVELSAQLAMIAKGNDSI